MFVLFFFSLPALLLWKQAHPFQPVMELFPVTVDPIHKKIAEDPNVESLLSKQNSPLSAAVANASETFDALAAAIASFPVYQLFSGSDTHFVIVNPGYRKEQVATAFGNTLKWDKTTQKSFLDSTKNTIPVVSEGMFSPGTYAVPSGTTALGVQSIINDRFQSQVVSHYGTSTASLVPLNDALTIASMVERETSDRNEMRIISGIIWNRIFNGMKLQIDATLQYAKGSKSAWWPVIRSRDKYIHSAYNTYQTVGLPPTPISNPSVAAVIAALNPKNTSCLFYFHDSLGQFHCSDTYEAHVALLKKYYGRGK